MDQLGTACCVLPHNCLISTASGPASSCSDISVKGPGHSEARQRWTRGVWTLGLLWTALDTGTTLSLSTTESAGAATRPLGRRGEGEGSRHGPREPPRKQS
ncbi:hypothetical protein BaRGS_00007485 [Batillaria attramentaria]|uniref:Uncharacterized protein n=1 Tax=Batillaria attramentaria TaxID=370345 RepID=A0ABD0LQ57_9CAEN